MVCVWRGGGSYIHVSDQNCHSLLVHIFTPYVHVQQGWSDWFVSICLQMLLFVCFLLQELYIILYMLCKQGH